MTANGYITTAAPFPVFIDPDVSGAWSRWPGDRTPGRMYGYIDLSGS
jgi:hypothetical protein